MPQKQYNICRALFTTNLFFFLFSAAQTCLYPFLPLFFRQIGLNATQTGILYSTKTLIHLFTAPMWAHCAKRFNRRRSVLIFALFVTIVTYLSLTLIPVLNKQPDGKCNRTVLYINISNAKSQNLLDLSFDSMGVRLPKTKTSYEPSSTVTPKLLKVPINLDLSNTADSIVNSSPELMDKKSILHGDISENLTHQANNIFLTSKESVAVGQRIDDVTTSPIVQILKATTTSASTTLNLLQWTNLHKKDYSDKNYDTFKNPEFIDKPYPRHRIFHKRPNPDLDSIDQSTNGRSADLDNPHPRKHQSHKHSKSDSLEYGKPDYTEYLDNLLDSKEADNTYGNSVYYKRHLQAVANPSLVNDFHTPESTTKTRIETTVSVSVSKVIFYDWKALTSMTFLFVLLILSIGEFFMSPVEKICNDSWYEYLDNLDESERFGSHKLFSALATAIVGISIVAGVEYSYCKSWIFFNPFLLHFYIFAAVCGIVFFCSMCYPLPGALPKSKQRKIEKSLKIMCCDIRMIVYIITMLLGGWLHSSTEIFLFWYVQDKGGSELVMGAAVSVAALSEAVMYFLYPCLIGWLSSNGIISISLFCLAGKFIYYSFLWSPWALVPIEVLQMFTRAALWRSVSFSSDQIPNLALNRFVKMVYRGIIWQIGMLLGSIISGYVYDKFGAPLLFRSYSIAAIVWFFLFVITMRCHPGARQPEGYHSLNLRKRFDDDTDEEKDDWLEKALGSEEVTLFDAKKRKRNMAHNHQV